MKSTVIMMACVYSVSLLFTALPAAHAQTATVKEESKNKESQMKEEAVTPDKQTPALNPGADKNGPNPGNHISKGVTPDNQKQLKGKKKSMHPGSKITVSPGDIEHFKVKENSPPPGALPQKQN